MASSGQSARAVAQLRGRLAEHARDPLHRSSYFLIGSLIASAGGGLIFWVAAAHLAPASAVGRASALISAVTLLSYLTGLGLPYGILRFGARDNGLASVTNGAILISAATSAAAGLVFCLGIGVWAPNLKVLVDTPGVVAIFAVANVAVGLAVIFDGFLVARRIAKWATLRAVITAIGRFGLLVVLVDSGATSVYLAGVIPFIAVSAMTLLALPRLEPRYRLRELRDPESLRPFLAYSLRMYPSSLLGGAPPFALPLIALAIVGPSETAYFFAAWSAVSVALVLPSMVANVVLSEGSRGQPWAASRRGHTIALMIVTPVMLLLILAAQPLLLVFGHDYAVAAWMLRILAVSLIPWAIMSLDLAAMRAEARYRATNLAMFALAITTIGGVVVLGGTFGLEGMALGWTLGNALVAGGVRAYASTLAAQEHTGEGGDVRSAEERVDAGDMSRKLALAEVAEMGPRLGFELGDTETE